MRNVPVPLFFMTSILCILVTRYFDAEKMCLELLMLDSPTCKTQNWFQSASVSMRCSIWLQLSRKSKAV